MSVTIQPEVADVLRRSMTEGGLLRLPEGQLPRPLYTATDNVLKALGGKWDRRADGHVFPFDIADKLANALGDGAVVSRQQALQLFETPVVLANRLVGSLGRIEGLTCLEPSAGLGRIVEVLALRDPVYVIAVEIDEENGKALTAQRKAHEIIIGDFLKQAPEWLACDAVAMNPPFTRNQDIRHVRHAFECLRGGGRLAAIVSEHGFIGQEREAVEWRQWLESLCARVDPIPASAFKESGTSVATRMVVLQKPS